MAAFADLCTCKKRLQLGKHPLRPPSHAATSSQDYDTADPLCTKLKVNNRFCFSLACYTMYSTVQRTWHGGIWYGIIMNNLICMVGDLFCSWNRYSIFIGRVVFLCIEWYGTVW